MSNERTWLIGVAIITLGICAAMPYYQQDRWTSRPDDTPPLWKSPADIPLRLRGDAELDQWLGPLQERDALDRQAARSRSWSMDTQASFQTPPQINPMFPTGIADPQPAPVDRRDDFAADFARPKLPLSPSTSDASRAMVESAGEDAAPGGSGHPEYVLHQVRNGDTLESIARAILGDSQRAMEIFHANRDVLVRPDVVPLRAKLRVPLTPLSPSIPTQPMTPIARDGS